MSANTKTFLIGLAMGLLVRYSTVKLPQIGQYF
jgi:hypothetical protein